MESTAWVAQECPTHGRPDGMLMASSSWVTQETSNLWVNEITLRYVNRVGDTCLPHGSVKLSSWNQPHGLYNNVQPMGGQKAC